MKNWSLNAKIIVIIGVFFVSSVVISVLGINRLSELNDAVDYIVTTLVKRVNYSTSLRGEARNAAIAEKNILVEESRDKIQEYTQDLENSSKEFEKVLNEAIAIASAEAKDKWRQMGESFRDFVKNSNDIRTLKLEGREKEALNLSIGKGRELRLKLEKISQELIDLNTERMNAENERTTEIYEASRLIMTTTSLVAILFGCALAYLVLRAVNASINKVIASLEDGANQVTSAAQQISSSSEELSQAATEQASSLEETASSVEEMSSMVQKNSENARKTASVANASHESASKGKDVVQNMIGAIQEINASNNEISDIVKVISEIGNKTKVINDIVFQTKLLSFNASVEAARAGEHGKGFAVVAEEVGNLAQMSGNAAKEISVMLEGSIQKVERLVAVSREKVEVGTKVASECGEVLDEIVHNVSNVTSMAEEIAKASDEQARGIQEITRAMSQLDQVTQQNAASSEEAASSAEELSGQAESLRGVVGELISAIKGAEGSRVAASAAIPRNNLNRTTLTSPKAKVFHIKANKNSLKAISPKGDHDGPGVGVEPSMKKAVGMDYVPSESDSRFEEV